MPPNHVAISIQVEDLQEYLDKAERLGAKTIAVFADPAGNNTGLHKF